MAYYLKHYLHLLPALSLLAGVLSPAPGTPPEDAAARINLALRRTADGLLRASGDSTSRIPAVEQAAGGVWRVRLDQPFSYEELPPLLQGSLDRYGIRQPYRVAVRRCADHTIDLGYHQLDFLRDHSVPCDGRATPAGCHYIEVSFLKDEGNRLPRAGAGLLLLLVLIAGAGFWWMRRKKPAPAGGQADRLAFGRSRLDVAGQILECGGVRQELTFREAKLLRLFVTHPDQVLDREGILREVWADEGVLVGRSVDVFVSRLRKKLAADPSVAIVAVHGVGYRLTVE